MATIKLRYFVSKPGARGPRHFWQPAKTLRAAGWSARRLSDDAAEAMAEAQRLNGELDKWRGGEPSEERQATYVGGRNKGPKPGSVDHLIVLYKASRRWAKLAPASQRGYRQCLERLAAWCGDFQARVISRPAVQDWYENNYEATPAFTNAVMRVARTLFKFGWDKGLVAANPFEKPGLIGTAPRLRILSPEEIDGLVAAADHLGLPSIGDAVLLGYYLGQRQADVLHLPMLRYQQANGTWRVKLRQAKTRTWIDIPAAPRLAARIEAARARNAERAKPAATIVVSEATGAPYKADYFRHVFAEVRALAAAGIPAERSGAASGGVGGAAAASEWKVAPCPSIVDAWYMDLRDTAVTTLAEADCTIPQICSITGHSEKSAYSILKHYLSLNGEMASQAIAKLVAYEERRRVAKEAAKEQG